MKCQAFGQALEDLFASGPIPALALAEGISEYLHGHDVVTIRTAFQGRAWADIDLLTGGRNALMDAFGFFRPEAKFYYWPGLMLGFLNRAARHHNGCLLDAFVEHIDPTRCGDETFQDLILAMGRQQSALVTAFLLEMAQADGGNWVAAQSLENYWDIFEKDIPKELRE
jgi:hypothetical protein